MGPMCDDRKHRFIALALVLACLALNVYRGWAVGIHRVAPLCVVQAFPAVLSDFDFDHRPDYTALKGVNDLFFEEATDHSSEAVNAGIENVLRHRGEPVDRAPYLISPDDKGIVDFVKLAFLLFGYRAEAVIAFYWLALAATCLVFVLRFGNQPWAVAMLVAFLLAHAAVLPIVVIDPQLNSVTAPRFMSVFGMVATLHLLLETFAVPEMKPARLAGIVVQAAVLVFVLHIRFATVWAVLCVLGGFAFLLARGALAHTLTWRLWPAAIPALVLLAGTVGLREYKQTAIAPEYYTDGGASHIFWHSVFSGLSYSPELADRYRIRIDDASIYEATHRYLVEHGQSSRWARMGHSEQRYDAAVRDMFFATCRKYPLAVFTAVAYHKPRALGMYAAWFLRRMPEPGYLDVLWPAARAEYQGMARVMDRDDLALRLFRPGCLTLLLLTGLWACRSLAAHGKEILGIAVLLGACSLMPSLLGYPIAHTINDALVSFGMLVYVSAMGAVAVMLGAGKHGLRSGARIGVSVVRRFRARCG